MDIYQNLFNQLDENNLNPNDAFNQSYDKSSDYKEMQNILTEVRKYDIYDFIARVSALNLMPENQNKSILFDALIASLLSLKRSEYNSTIKMSSGKFRKIINQIDNMKLKMGLDPAESTFLEGVIFYGNYMIFAGINFLPGYCLQMIINTLYLHSNNFDEEFLRTISKLIHFILELSNTTATELGYKLEDLKRIEEKNIVIPSSKDLERMSELIMLDNSYVKFLVEDDSIIGEMYSDFGHDDLEKALNAEQQKFFVKPFIKTEDNRTIILNISILSSFVFHKIIWLADKYGYKDELINAYNASVWKDCRRSLYELGHKKIKEMDMGIDLMNRNDYKEVLLNVCNNQIMVVMCVCDDGKDYSKEAIFDRYPSDRFNKLIEKRIVYFYEKLLQQNIKDEDIFHVIIINSFGRSITVGLNAKCHYRLMALNPYDLKCIAINEKSDSIFLPRYIRARSKLKSGSPNFFSELNSIEIYVSNKYSFYLGDDFNPKENVLYIAPGDSIDYIIRAINKEKRHLVESYKDGHFIEVVLNDERRNIFTDLDYDVPRASLLVEFFNVRIWVYSPEIKQIESLDISFSIVDAISYWISECKEILEYYNFIFSVIKFQIKLTGSLQEYYFATGDGTNWKEGVTFEVYENSVTLTWTPEAFRALNCKDNSVEKLMVESILDIIKNFTNDKNINKSQLDYTFLNPLKKKFFTLDYTNNPYLKPLPDRSFCKIKLEDENELLDDIGGAVLASGKWSYGIVIDDDRSVIANYVVGYLYELLQKQVKELRPDYLIELVCLDLEKVMYNLMLAQSRYANDVACYPEKQEKIFNDFNELNKTSRALKFLAEYIAACPPNGTRKLGEWQYERLLAICSLIIDWAYKNDLFYYKIFNTPVEILKSDRVGMKQDEFNKLQSINIKAREVQLNYTSTSNFREKLPHKEFPNIFGELNSAFLDEYTFSFDDFCNCVLGMLSFGDEKHGEVKKAPKSELASWLVENSMNLDNDKVEKVLQYISLSKREDFLKPLPPYRPEDVYPWRFNRELSFTRRPVIIREEEVIWGNRQLFHMLTFIIDLIYEGKLKTRKKKLTTLIGKISNKRGDDFNDRVYYKIKGIGYFIVDRNLKKINHKNIADENGNTLGGY